MKLLVLLNFDVPVENPDAAAEIVRRIDPPALPYFAGVARITIDPWASEIERQLDEDDEADER